MYINKTTGEVRASITGKNKGEYASFDFDPSFAGYYIYDEESESVIADEDSKSSDETQSELKVEYDWAASEIADADIQVNYCLRGNSKATGTKFEWWAYQEACCDYASCNDEGVYSVVDMSDIDTDSDDYLFKRTYEDVEYIVAIDDSGRPVSPSDGGVTTTSAENE